MCGIAGQLGGEPAAEAMIDALKHRGPDGVRTHCESAMAFGHARLAIIDRAGGETAYQFVMKNKIKKIHVTDEQFNLLSRGKLGIVRLSGQYQLIPLDAAEKVMERAPHWPVVIAKVEAEQPDEDDPYADFKIPDDLMW